MPAPPPLAYKEDGGEEAELTKDHFLFKVHQSD